MLSINILPIFFGFGQRPEEENPRPFCRGARWARCPRLGEACGFEELWNTNGEELPPATSPNCWTATGQSFLQQKWKKTKQVQITLISKVTFGGSSKQIDSRATPPSMGLWPASKRGRIPKRRKTPAIQSLDRGTGHRPRSKRGASTCGCEGSLPQPKHAYTALILNPQSLQAYYTIAINWGSPTDRNLQNSSEPRTNARTVSSMLLAVLNCLHLGNGSALATKSAEPANWT